MTNGPKILHLMLHKTKQNSKCFKKLELELLKNVIFKVLNFVQNMYLFIELALFTVDLLQVNFPKIRDNLKAADPHFPQ